MEEILFDYVCAEGIVDTNVIREINRIVSGYRFTAMKSHGFIRQYCNQKANDLEFKLRNILG